MIERALASLRAWVERVSLWVDRLHLDAHRTPETSHGPACGCPRCDQTKPEARPVRQYAFARYTPCQHPEPERHPLDSYRWICGSCGTLLDPPREA